MKKVLWWIGGIIVGIVLLTVADHMFIAINPGNSMNPSFKTDAILIVMPFFAPQRGEIVVFREPKNNTSYFVKRIVGLPNETVQIQDGEVLINGKVLDEPYVNSTTTPMNGSETSSSITLGNAQFFLMGDNRADSYDSRSYGPILRSDIVKKVVTEL